MRSGGIAKTVDNSGNGGSGRCEAKEGRTKAGGAALFNLAFRDRRCQAVSRDPVSPPLCHGLDPAACRRPCQTAFMSRNGCSGSQRSAGFGDSPRSIQRFPVM